MSDLLHWHKIGDEPSVCQLPADCCTVAFGSVLGHAIEQARHEERRRIILGAVDAIELYWDAAVSVRTGPDAELIATVAAKAIEAITRTGCICPRIDVTTLGGPYATMPGLDSRCGMHERERT